MTSAATVPLSWECRIPLRCVTLSQRAPQAGRTGLDQNNDWEMLLARANDGDGAAFARFLTLVSPALRKVIRSRGASLPPDQHEDILQDVLLAIHLKRQSWRRGSPVRPWLYAVARYKVIDAFRRKGTAIHLPIEDFDDILPEVSPDTPLATRDATRQTDQMLAQIDNRSAALVRAVRLDGQSAEAAGEKLGLSGPAARVALHRAMKRLKSLAERTQK